MAHDYNRFREWLAQVEHELIVRGLSSTEATAAIVKNEDALRGKFGNSTAVQIATDLYCKSR